MNIVATTLREPSDRAYRNAAVVTHRILDGLQDQLLISDFVVDLMRHQKLSVKQLSAKCGITEQTLRRRLASPSAMNVRELADIARALDVAPRELLEMCS